MEFVNSQPRRTQRIAGLCIVSLGIIIIGVVRNASAQAVQSQSAEDSLHQAAQSEVALARLDSLIWARRAAEDKALLAMHQVASQRDIDLTGDGKPERLRIEGDIKPGVDETVLTFTIRTGKKLLYQDTWKAADYFDPIDHQDDTAKLRDLYRNVTIAFANENFTPLSAAVLQRVFENRGTADLHANSPEVHQLEGAHAVMFNVYAGRNNLYGLAWLPSKHKFVKVWRN